MNPNPTEIPLIRRVACLSFLLMFLASVAGAESVTGRINADRDRLFSFRASSFNQAVITAMWKDADTDCDLLAFVIDDDGEVLPLGVGIASTENLERLVVGIGSGVEIFVLVSVFSGGPTSFQLNAQSTRSDSLASPRTGMREIGEDDPRFAAGRRFLERTRERLKATR